MVLRGRVEENAGDDVAGFEAGRPDTESEMDIGTLRDQQGIVIEQQPSLERIALGELDANDAAEGQPLGAGEVVEQSPLFGAQRGERGRIARTVEIERQLPAHGNGFPLP
jgi:hypothetical protein